MIAIGKSGGSEIDVKAADAAAKCVVETHHRLAKWLRIGMKLGEIDSFVARTLDDLKCKSCFLGYRQGRSPAFPSHACLSVNECVVHGTAAYYPHPMKPGDILKIDIGVTHRGWIGDAAWTYVFGQKSPDVERLTTCGKESLALGVQQLRPGNRLIHWAQAVQGCVEGNAKQPGYGYHLIRGLGGHGYGKKLHAPPFVSNVVPGHSGDWSDALLECHPGLLVAVEPMIAIGTSDTKTAKGQWPVFTADGSMSVHYEHDVLVTADGPLILTKGLEDLNDLITA